MMFGAFPQTFNKQYRCYSVSMLTGTYRQDVERGGKIIMPPSALDVLTRQNIDYPMLFKLTHKKMERVTHCGVLEFVADEGKVYLPYWMMKNLFLDEGDLLNVESCSLSVATYSKFEPQSVDFLDITNPKAVLENILRGFACLTKGDMIAINYNNKSYELQVLETKPSDAVSIIECDMSVEFAAPIGYVEPQRHRPAEQDPEEMQVDGAGFIDTDQFMAFQGQGNRLDGKKKNVDSKPVPLGTTTIKRGIPNYDYKKGTITFIRTVRPSVTNGTNGEDVPDFEAFKGEGQQLRKKNKKK
ncbi:ubiquitin recognition factor in ER-associated degradation protein 1-like isoform X2 [Asterias rubens]|uniref:ubiquitin recognition factor in ER-associated degradation protein 1-like isoform X2 n=1 Tax=Asterias rubens TaxID=7604 RepID=UPI00145513FE|nr:ubiquitin recognition factor in ER-associated degradation protein 1-like isoform X2 [Asterias rubens]